MERNLIWTLELHSRGYGGVASHWMPYNPSIHGIIDQKDMYTLEESRAIDEQRYLAPPPDIKEDALTPWRLQIYQLQLKALWRKSISSK